MALNAVNICNMALTRIGANTITSLTDGTRESNLCNTVYENSVEDVLSMGEWSKAKFQATLVQLDAPAFDYSYAYQLPTAPRIITLLDVQDAKASSVEYTIQGDHLLINNTADQITYIGYLDNPADYGVYLKAAIISKIAYELAFTLTGSQQLQERLFQKYRVDLRTGLAEDGNQGNVKVLYNTDLTNTRL